MPKRPTYERRLPDLRQTSSPEESPNLESVMVERSHLLLGEHEDQNEARQGKEMGRSYCGNPFHLKRKKKIFTQEEREKGNQSCTAKERRQLLAKEGKVAVIYAKEMS